MRSCYEGIDTIYLGGGSPSLLSVDQAGMILESVACNFRLAEGSEITFEMNPGDMDEEKITGFRKAGFNRVSIGTQSFDNSDLSFLKRTHSAEENYLAIEYAVNAGFDNISGDIIVGLPEQNLIRAIDSDIIKELSHISVYILEQVEKRWHSSEEEEEESDERYYFEAVDILGEAGFTQYEISNFSKPGRESKHNMKYWNGGNYIGAGLSASGFGNSTDYQNEDREEDYFMAIDEERLPIKNSHKSDIDVRTIVTGLRTVDGVSSELFKGKRQEAFEFCLSEGLLIQKSGRVSVPQEKFLLLNEILGMFIEG